MAVHKYGHKLVGNTTASKGIAEAFVWDPTLKMDVGTTKDCLRNIAAHESMEKVVAALRKATGK